MPEQSSATQITSHKAEALHTVNAIQDLALMMRQTDLDQRQRQYMDKILVSVAALQNLMDPSALDSAAISQIPPEQAAAAATTALKNEQHLPRVLLVEDDEINQAIVCELLKEANVTVDVASSGEEATEAVKHKIYKVIFMDINMPGIGGIEATRQIRAAGFSMPIVGMTGASEEECGEDAFDAGMTDYLTKPVNPDKVFHTLNHWLASPVYEEKSDSGSADDNTGILPDTIAGFNVAAGLAAVGNNKQLYADLLEKFAARYASVAEDIAICLQNDDIEKALRLAHTVKGIAANLGAHRLAESAGELEKIIKKDPQKITVNLEKLMIRLNEAITSVHEALKKQVASQQPHKLIDVSKILSPHQAMDIRQQLIDAITKMEENWNKADEVSQGIYTILSGSHLEHPALLLKKAVEDFAPQKAQSICEVLQMALLKAAGKADTAPQAPQSLDGAPLS